MSWIAPIWLANKNSKVISSKKGPLRDFICENRPENRSLYGTRVLDSSFVYYPRSNPLK